MSQNPSNSNELPPWLRGVPLPPRPSDANAPFEDRDDPAAMQAGSFDMHDDFPTLAATPPHDEQATDAVPGWLRDSAAEPAAAADEVPDWLRDLGADATASQPNPARSHLNDSAAVAADDQDDATVPDWLRDLGDANAAPAEQPSPNGPPDWVQADAKQNTAAEDDVPDWLRASAASDANSDAAEDAPEHTPDWLRDLGAAAPASALSNEQPSHTSPKTDDWLTQPRAGDQNADATSTWLTPLEDEQDAEEAEVPAWLLAEADLAAAPEANNAPRDEVSPEPQPPIMPPSAMPAAPTDDEAGVPSWLSAASLDEVRSVMSSENDISPEIAPFTFEGQSETISGNSLADAPAWLQGPTEEAESSATPSWLDALTPTAPEPEALHDAPADAPDWLHSMDVAGDTDADSFDALTQASSAEQETEPRWLHNTGDTPAPSETTDVPAWLQDADATEAPSSGEVPAWLRAEERDDAEPAEALPLASDVPAWMQDADTTEATPAPSGDVPAWLRAEERDDAEPAEALPLASDVPAWMQDADTTEATPSDDVPAWMQDAQREPAQASADVPPWMHDDAGTPLPPTMPGDASLPAWLQDETLDSGRPAAPAAPERGAPAPFSDASSWFDSIGDDERNAIDEPALADEPDGEFLGGTELPAWLRPAAAQREQPSEADQRDARALDWLSRLGGVEEEPAIVVPEEPGPRFAPPAAPVRSQEHLNAVALLERLAARPVPAAAALPPAAPARRWQQAGAERLLYVGLLVILLAALLVPALSANLEVPPVAASAQPLFAQLDTLNENDVVLVGYEWNARRVSELRPLEQAVMGHLLAKKVKLVIVSTDPQGTLVAFDLRQSLAAANYERGGLDYIWLGYKPGGEVALRSLAQDLPGALRSDFYGDDANISPLARGFRTDTPLTSLDAFAAIVVLADEPLDVQGWMEQIHRSVPQTPIAFLLPSETAPITQPYMRQPNVLYLAGRAGALAYEELRGTSAADQTVQVQYGQQRLGLLVFAALLLVGIVIGVAGAAANGRKDAA